MTHLILGHRLEKPSVFVERLRFRLHRKISNAETYLFIETGTRGSSKEKFKGHNEDYESSSDGSEDDDDASTDSFGYILEDIRIHVQGLMDLSPSSESPAKEPILDQMNQERFLSSSGFRQVIPKLWESAYSAGSTVARNKWLVGNTTVAYQRIGSTYSSAVHHKYTCLTICVYSPRKFPVAGSLKL